MWKDSSVSIHPFTKYIHTYAPCNETTWDPSETSRQQSIEIGGGVPTRSSLCYIFVG